MPAQKNYDLIIVGSGIGGSILAARIAERGVNPKDGERLRIAMLEAGPYWKGDPKPGYGIPLRRRMITNVMTDDSSDRMWPWGMVKMVGGSTNHYGASVYLPYEVDYKHWVAEGTDWTEFENERFRALSTLYDGRRIPRKESRRTALYQITQDMWVRLGIQQGYVEPPDYRDELAELIGKEFGTRREFCRKTGISEQMLSHALAHRKHIHIDRLVHALHKIGYRLSITPAPSRPRPERRRRGRAGSRTSGDRHAGAASRRGRRTAGSRSKRVRVS